jgi:hypothetical protein
VVESCDRLGDALPAHLSGLEVRSTRPRSSLTHAWGSPAVTLTCGVPRPAGYAPRSTSTLGVNGVQWFQQVGSNTVTWTAIRPSPLAPAPIYVQLVIPKHYQAAEAFLTALAEPLKSSLT